MQEKAIRIIAAVVDTNNLTVYKENGESMVIPQGDPRVRVIVDTAVPLLLSQGYADISIAQEEDSSYVQFEALSNGAVKLFRIAKSKLLDMMGIEEAENVPSVMPISIGVIPTIKASPTMSAVEEILQHAVSVNSPEFHEVGIAKQGDVVEDSGDTIKKPTETSSEDTIIAVVDGTIIPGVELIKTQFTRAAKLGSSTGVEAFLSRIGKVIASRKHSIEDLLKFMERGDMPIADDGTILIYKVLNLRNKTEDKRTFVDCHTGKVKQWVGAYVCMDTSLVDPNRNNECSNGLHVARRGYVKEFGGSACVLAKLAPEDVIAVPSYDANKMRVCGYHIIAELTPEQFTLVAKNKPITDDPAGKVLLGKTLAGQHIGRTHEVRITGALGQGVQVTELVATKVKKVEVPVAEALQNPSKAVFDAPIDPKSVINKVEQLSRKEIAANLYAEGKVDELKAYKKAAKVSWEKLGVPDPDVTPPVVKAAPVAEPEPVSKVAELVEATHGEGSYKERIQKLLAIGITSVGVAQAILEMKKKAKKSWETLGVSATQVEEILKTVA